MPSWPRNYEIIISDIIPNSCRPNVATNIGTSTCAVDSPIDRGSGTRRAVRRAERSTRGHRACSRWSGPVTGSWGCVARRTIVSEPPTIQHKRTEQTSQLHRQGRVPCGAHQPSEQRWKEPRVPGAPLDHVDVRAGPGGPHLLLRQTRGVRGRGDHGSGGRVDKVMHSGRFS